MYKWYPALPKNTLIAVLTHFHCSPLHLPILDVVVSSVHCGTWIKVEMIGT